MNINAFMLILMNMWNRYEYSNGTNHQFTVNCKDLWLHGKLMTASQLLKYSVVVCTDVLKKCWLLVARDWEDLCMLPRSKTLKFVPPRSKARNFPISRPEISPSCFTFQQIICWQVHYMDGGWWKDLKWTNIEHARVVTWNVIWLHVRGDLGAWQGLGYGI